MTSPSNASRDWLDTRQVRRLLGNISQQRVSQLVRAGELVAESDDEGRLMYDRATVERYARDKANLRAANAADREERRALRDEARERAARMRKQAARAREDRERWERDMRERQVAALESIAATVKRFR